MDLFLQIWGGLFYLVNKILFAVAESKQGQSKRKFRIMGWLIYILGVPPWIIILIGQQNWITASIEAGGIPTMFLGLYNAYYDDKKPNKFFNRLVAICTYGSLAFGLYYSLQQNGGITSLSQLFELGAMFGFLLGSYFLAKNRPVGWLFFMLMNLSVAILMFIQDKPILMIQQLLSLFFVVYGFNKNRAALAEQS